MTGLFSSRGYNIESLSVAPTEDPSVSRLTLVTTGALFAFSCSSFSDFTLRGASEDARKFEDAPTVPDSGSDALLDSAPDAHVCPNLDAADAHYHLFVSSKTYPGTFAADASRAPDGSASAESVLAIADGLCSELGAKVNSCARWRAILSADGRPPTARITPGPNGFFILWASDGPATIDRLALDAGFSGNPILPITTDEQGRPVPADSGAWTGEENPFNRNCSRWTSAGMGLGLGLGAIGQVGALNANWLRSDGADCSSLQHLYCVEQPP